MNRSPRSLVTLAAASALLLASCSNAETSDEQTQELDVAYGWYPTCFDYAQSNPFAFFGRQVLDTLVSQDPETGEIQAFLAQEWEVSADATEYEFTLRQDVTFSNGEELNAEVVAENFETLWDLSEQGVSVTPGAYLRGFESAEVLDDFTLRITFGEPNAGFLQANAEGQFGIIAPESLEKSPEERCSEGTVGTGPFVLEETVQDERIVYTKREDYNWAAETYGHTGEAHIDTLTVHIVPEESVRASGVASGDYDVAYSITESGLSQAQGNDEVEPLLAPDRSVVNTLVVNSEDDVLAAREVRQALQHGIDREELVDTFYGEGVEPATDVVGNAHPFYQDRGQLLAFDPERSRELLEEAGWEEGDDGIRTRGDERLEISLTYVSESIGAEAAGWEYLQSRLAEIGIDLVLDPVSDAELADLQGSDDWQLTVYQGASRSDADGIAAFYSTELSVWGQQTGSAEIDALLEEQSATVDPDERQTLVDQAVGTILDEAYGIPLYDSSQVLLVSTEVDDLTFPLNSWEPLFYAASKN